MTFSGPSGTEPTKGQTTKEKKSDLQCKYFLEGGSPKVRERWDWFPFYGLLSQLKNMLHACRANVLLPEEHRVC